MKGGACENVPLTDLLRFYRLPRELKWVTSSDLPVFQENPASYLFPKELESLLAVITAVQK